MGIDINYHSFQTGKQALDALIGKGADIATTADVPITLAGLARQDISILATIEYSSNNIYVVARKDSGIRKPENLKGKIIATFKGGGPLFFTHKYLAKLGINLDDVTLVFLNPSDMISALVRKDIDAFIFTQPSVYFAIKEIGMENLVIFNPDDVYGETWNIVTMKDYEKEHPGVIKRFLIALVQAENFLKKNPDKSLEIIEKHSGVEKNTLTQVMKKQNHGVVLNDVLIKYLSEEAEWAIKQRLSSNKEIPDYSKLINKGYLEQIKPEGVTI